MTASGARRTTASGTDRPSDGPLPADRRERGASRARPSRLSRIAGHARRAAAGLLLLAGLAAGLLAPEEAEAQGSSVTPIWTATLTVEEQTSSNGDLWGYGRGIVGNYGSLSNTTITVGGTNHTVNWLYTHKETPNSIVNFGRSAIRFDKSYRLCLGGSTYVDFGGGGSHTAVGAIGWEDEDTVELNLIQTTESCANIASAVTLESSDVANNQATLTISGHTGQWWYKRTDPAAPACTSVPAGTSTATPTGLTAGTSHTYEAYSASGCAAGDKIADETFTTTGNAPLKGLTVTPGPNSLVVSWDAYMSRAESSSTTHYRVLWKLPSDMDHTSSNLAVVAVPTTTYTITSFTAAGETNPLAAGTTYDVYVAAVHQRAAGSIPGAFAEASGTPTAAVALTSSKVTDTTATLTISSHTAQWWHKRTKPTTGNPTCQGPIAANTSTANLTGLTPGTDYEWKAYSATGCADGSLLATETFSTPKAAVGTIAQNTATLTVTNHPATWYYKAGSANCSAAQSGTTASLTGLTAGTAYTYKTYSNNSCTTLLATAAEFTTLAAASVSLTADTVRTRVNTLATLELTGHTGQWWYKKTSPAPAGTCTAVTADDEGNYPEAPLSGLSVSTQYAYEAYSASGCAAGNKLDDVTFTTSAAPPAVPGLTVTENAATLTLSWTDTNSDHLVQAYWKSGMQDYPGDGFGSTATSAARQGFHFASSGTSITIPSAGFSDPSFAAGTEYTVQVIFHAPVTSEIQYLSEIKGTPGPKLAAESITSTGATLKVANHPSTWYHKKISPTTPAPVCSGAQSGTSGTLTSLAPSTAYTWATFSDNTCTNANKIKEVSFSTGAAAPPIWSATMTVRAESNSQFGYADFNYGSVSTKSVTYQGSSTTVQTLYYDVDSSHFTAFSSIATGNFKLCLDGTAVGTKPYLNGTSQTFTTTGLDWENFQTVKAALVESSASCPSGAGTRPTLAAEDVTSSGATLKVANYPSEWYYKRTSPTTPAASCSTKQTGATATLTSLAAGTDYTFTTFADSACTANELNTIKDVSFSTTAAANSPATGAPSISGTPQVGQMLTASKGTIADTDGLPATDADYSYRWIRVTNGSDADITGATGSGSTYTVTATDLGKTLKVRATFTDGGGTSESRTSAATAAVTAAAAPTLSESAVKQTSAKLALTNHSGNWYLQQTVPVPASTSCLGPNGASATVSVSNLLPGTAYTYKAHSGGPCTDANALAEVSFTTQDLADVLTVSPATLTVAENGGTDTFTVKLKSQPTANVTVNVSSRATGVATVLPRSLTFTTSNWNATQSVTVTGVNDSILNPGGGREAKIQLNASSTQDAFNLGTGQDFVTVTVTDDEMPGVAAPEADVTPTGARLTVTHHPSSWHYKQTSPATTPAATCQGPVTARLVNLSGLTPLTEYTFETYSDNACGTKLADVTFTTDPAPLALKTTPAVTNQSWQQHHDVDLELPEATGGTAPLSYTLTGTLPTGLSFDAATRKITGTASTLASARTLTYKVTDSATPAKTAQKTFSASVVRDRTAPTMVSVTGDPDTGGLSPTVKPFGLLLTVSERACVSADDVFTMSGQNDIAARATEAATCGSWSGTFAKGTKTDAGWVYAFDINPAVQSGASTVSAVVDPQELVDRSGNFGSGGTRTVRFSANIFVDLAVPAQTDKVFAVGEAVPTTGDATSTLNGQLRAATGGTGTKTYTLRGPSGTAQSPNLPAGLTFDATDLQIEGTPTTATTGDGTTLTLTATDSAAATASKTFKVKVVARPMITVAATPAVLGIGDTAAVTLTFPEAANAFDSTFFSVVCGGCGATVSAFTANAAKTVWSATLTPPSTGHGTIKLKLGGNAWTSPTTGLQNGDSNEVSVEYDNRMTKPVITVDDSVLGIGETATVTLTFAEAVTRATDAVFTASASGGGTATVTEPVEATGANAGKVWTATLTPPAGEKGTITLGLPANFATSDRTGNANAAADNVTVTYDTQAPTVEIEAGGEPGDALAGDMTLNKGETVIVTVTFSEQVTGFAAAELTKTAGTLAAAEGGTEGRVYKFTLTPPATGSGSITLGVAANVATDGASNGNTAATSVAVPYDNTVLGAPTGMDVVPGDDEPATSLKVTWNAVTDATGYLVQWKAPDESYATTRQQAVTTTSHTITGLTTGTVYKVRAKSTRLNVPDSGWSDEMEGSPYAGPIDIVLSRETVTVCEDAADSKCEPEEVGENEENGNGQSSGGSATYTVRLNTPPKEGAADVKVRVLEHSRRLSVSPKTLTFTRANWSVRQTVTVTAVQDDIAWEEDGQTVRIRHLRSGGGRKEGISAKKVTATVHDDDTASVVIDTDPNTAGAQTALEVDEGGTATYTIALTSQPRSTVHAYQVHGKLLVGGKRIFGNDPAIPALLYGDSTTYVRFTAKNWRTPQTVVVSGRRDLRKDGDRTATIKHSTGAGSYYGKPVADVTLTVKDTDTIPVRVYGGSAVMPPHANRAWWVAFGGRTRSAVTLTLESSDTDVAEVDVDPDTPGLQNTLILPPGNWVANNHLVGAFGKSDGTATIRVKTVTGDPGFSGLAGAELGNVRVCAGVSYKGGVARCPEDPGYQLATAQGEEETFAPAFTAEAEDQAAQVGVAFSYTVPEATDPQGDAIAYRAALIDDGPLPDWLAFDPATRTFSGTPGTVDALAVLEIAVSVAETETELPLADWTTFTVTVADADGNVPNKAPAFGTAAAGQSAVAGKAFSYTVPQASDPDEGDTLTYTAALADGEALPVWLGFDAATRTLSGTPGKGDAPANLSIAVTATDDGEPKESATTTFALKVSPAVAACETAVTLGEAPVVLEGEPWNAPGCMAHHRADSPARYFKIALAKETALELDLRTRETAALFVSTGRPANGLGTPPKGGMEHRLKVRRANGKLVKEAATPALPPGVNIAVALAVPVTLPAGDHFVEVVLAGEAKADPPLFGLTIRRKPPELSVADARAKEDAGSIAFKVTLDRALASRATVDWATSDGTALAGADYTAASGTLAFEPGETEKTVSVAILDDAHDEGEETFTLTLSNAQGVKLGDAVATGTISNEDPLLEAWLARFGRSVASQTLEALAQRFALPRGSGSHLTLGGRRIGLDKALQASGSDPGQAAPAPAGYPGENRHAAGIAPQGLTSPRGGEVALAVPGAESGRDAVYRWRIAGASHAELKRPGPWLTRSDRAEAGYRVPRRGDVADRSALDDGAWIEFERTATDSAGRVSTDTVRLTVMGSTWKPAGAAAAAAGPIPGGPEAGGVGDAFAALADEADGSGGDRWRRLSSTAIPGDPGLARGQGMTGRQLLLGSSFHLALGANGDAGSGADADGRWTAWGRAGLESFSGSDGGLTVDGEVLTGIFGADWERGGWLAGVALTRSTGDGGARQGAQDYDIDSRMTAVNPYLRLTLSDRLTAWGVAGWGTGELEVAVKGEAPERYRTDLEMTLAAFGGRAALLEPAAHAGFGLALKGDAFLVRMESDAAGGSAGGRLAAAAGESSRLRLGLEASRAIALEGGSALTPTLEVGLRHDGGDAETGAGLEVGGGLAWSDPSSGVSADLRARTLAAHAESGYREWGVSGGLRIAPGARGRGLSLALTPAWGAEAYGADRVWGARDAAELVPGAEADPTARFDAEFGYGLPVHGERFTGTPWAGFGYTESQRRYRLGWRLAPGGGSGGFTFSLEAARNEAANDNQAEHTIGLRLDARW